MGVTRKERFLKAMLEDNAEACGGGVTREEKLIASAAKKVCDNDALEGGGGGVSSWNDLTDAPFGEREEWVEFIPQTSVTFSNTSEYKNTFASYGSLMIDCEYKVIFDGKEYYVKAVYQGINLMPSGGLSEEYPFQFQYSFGQLYVLEPGKHTIAVYQMKNVVTKIPGKYIVTTIRLMNNDFYALDDNYSPTKAEIKTALEEGFNNGVVRVFEFANDKWYCGTLIGYNMSGNTANVQYCNGSDATIKEAAWSFA